MNVTIEALPKDADLTNLASWTALDDPEAKRFAGAARYSISFQRPSGDADDCVLDLENEAAAARCVVEGEGLRERRGHRGERNEFDAHVFFPFQPSK